MTETRTSFGETHDIAITILVDNHADLLLKSSDTVKRLAGKPLLAEHGFAALVDLRAAGLRILCDAGLSRIALLENMAHMQIEPTSIDKIVLSHGHYDHVGAMTALLERMALAPRRRRWDAETPAETLRRYAAGGRMPLVAHPAAFRERWNISQDGAKDGPMIVPRALWEALGAEIVLSEGPYPLGPGCWMTGAVPRLSFEHAGTPATRYYREGDVFHQDILDDDQAIVLNITGKGLVILSGCAHSGIINTVAHARRISGVERVWAVVGGFHLAPAGEDEIERTIDELEQIAPVMVVPTHCTGVKAVARFVERMPGAFVPCAVGTTFLF